MCWISVGPEASCLTPVSSSHGVGRPYGSLSLSISELPSSFLLFSRLVVSFLSFCVDLAVSPSSSVGRCASAEGRGSVAHTSLPRSRRSARAGGARGVCVVQNDQQSVDALRLTCNVWP
eukprot:TRINITY_DN77728_c0_g1_i1.p1 TRINITY_DN77728_c0_g1~~TRINITY_DN77728_c0_g1_i1.p1  ORF type:complete len:119 (+),score=1.27 TRINITY_DN77728_c0_g1_i1:45-401(+)